MSKNSQTTATQSVFDIIPYWRSVSDCILHTDGRITGGLELRGPALECLSDEQLEQLHTRLSNFLHALPDSTELQFLYQVRPFSPILDKFRSENITTPERYRYIWEEKAHYLERQSNIWHTRLFLFLSLPYQADVKRASFFTKIGKSFSRTKLKNVLRSTSDWTDLRVQLIHRAMAGLKLSLAGIDVPCRELTACDLESLIYETLNPTRSRQLPYKTDTRTGETGRIKLLREKLVYSNFQALPRELILDDVVYRVMTLRDIPQIQYVGLINKLLTIREFPFDITMGIQPSPPDSILSALKRSENIQANLQKQNSRNYEAENRQDVISEVIQELVRGDTKAFSVSFAIRYSGRTDDELSHAESLLRQCIHLCGEAKELKEEFSYPECFVATLPGASYLFEGKRTLHTITPQTLSLLPIYQTSPGASRPVALFKSRTDELVGVDPFNPQLSAWNAVIFGPTGRGKSFLAQFLLLQYLRIKPKIIIVDVGGSYRRFTQLIGGDYIELNSRTNASLNPFLERKGEPEPELIGFLAGVVERMVKNENDGHLDKVEQYLIRTAIKTLYQTRAYPLNFEGLRLTMKEIADGIDDAEDKQILKRLEKRLRLWTEGEGRDLLVSEQPLSLDSAALTIDLAGLSSNKELQGIAIQILAGLVWQQLQHTPGPKIVLFDEVWQHLKDPTAARLLDQLYRTARKHHACVFSISQQLEDFLDNETRTSIVANSATRFILRTDREFDLLKKVFQLNDTELDLIRGLKMRRGYFSEVFAAFGDEHHCLRIEPSPAEYWLCTTHPQDLAAEQELIAEQPKLGVRERVRALASRYPRGVQ